VVTLAAGGAGASVAVAHEVQYLGVDVEVGVADHQGFTWTVEAKARVRCSGAEQTDIGITFTQLRDYGQPGGNAIYLSPPPNTYVKRNVVLAPGLYELAAPAVACRSNQPEPDGRPAVRTRLRTTRVLRARAIVRSKAGRKRSRPFTIISRG
jgi:hypothetical protein